MDAVRLAVAKQMFLDNEIDQETLNGYVLKYGGDPVSVGASTAVVEPPKAETEPDPFKACSKCDKDWNLDNHAPQCGFKDATSPLVKANAKIKALQNGASNGASIPPVSGLETVRVFELPFNEAKKTTNYYAHSTAAKTADKSLPYEGLYMDMGKFAKGSKLKVTVEVMN